MQLVDPTVDRFEGQVVYLDFDGAEDVDYHGPVEVNGIGVPAFAAPGSLAGKELEIIGQTLGLVQSNFASSGVVFTLDRPLEGAFSTVYVGGNGAAFSEFGEFPGLAEQVDAGNQNLNDIALVFSDDFAESDASTLAQRLAMNITHETGHLLGYAHDETAVQGGLSAVAAESGYIVSMSPSSFTGGQATSLTVRVYNSGDSDDMIIQCNAAPSGWTVSPSYLNPYMASGTYYNAVFTVTPPLLGGSGTITWEFLDDDVLSNDRLDIEYQSVSATAVRPDLSASIDALSEPWRWGTAVSASLSVTNQGTAASGSFRVDLVASNDSIIGDADDQTITYWNASSLASGATWSTTYNWTLPETPYSGMPSSGTVYYGIKAAVVTNETDTGDNNASDAVTMSPAEQGDIVSASPSSFTGGQATTVTVRVQNIGLSDDMIIQCDSLPSGWSVSPTYRNPYMTSGSYYDAQFTVTPPLLGGSGTIVWGLYDDDITSNDLLDTYSQSVSATAVQPDLSSSIDALSEPWRWGTAVSASLSVTNQGNAASGAFRVDLVASNNSTIGDGDDYTITYWNASSVNGGAAWSTPYNWTLPETPYAGMPASGTVYYGIKAAVVTNETDTSDNNASDPVTMSPAEQGQIVSVTPSTFTGSQATTVTVRVQNIGLGDDMIIECDSLPTGWSVSPVNVNPYIASGAYYDAQFVVTPPQSGGSGTIVWKFYDDDLGIHPSGSDLLATYSQSVSATAVWPDLTAYGVSVTDTTVNPGQSITVNWTAKNQGQAGAGATQQGVMWSSDTTINRSDTLLEREYLGSMGVNVTSPEAHTINIPANAVPGTTYYIGVYADYDLTETESDENNGSGAIAITINQADLVVTDILMNGQTALPSVKSGDSVSLDFDVLNQGSAPTIADVHMRWYWGTTSGSTANYIEEGSLGTINGLAAGEAERETDASWTIPALAAGKYWLTGVIDWDGRVPESSDGNNSRSESFTVVRPDLVAYGLSVTDATVNPGQSITVNWTAKNQGQAGAGATQQGVMWSSDTTINRSDTLLEREYLGSMGVNVTSPEAHTINIPANAVPGTTYYIGVYADYDLTETESDENNGSGAIAITINQADLVVTDILMNGQTALPSVKSGDSVSLDFDVLNQGSAPTIADVHMRWYWGTSSGSTANYIDEGSLGTLNGLAAGEAERETDAFWTIPSLTAGTYWLTGVIDWDGRVPESNEGNNTRSESFTVIRPDLIAYGLSVTDTTVNPGQSITVNWTAKNQGQAGAGATQQGVMWSTDSSIIRSDTLLEREYLGSMGVNVTSPEAHTITIPTNATPGATYYIGVYADYDLTESESDENNNGSSAISVTINQADLITQDITVEGQTDLAGVTIYPGDSITLDALSKNIGTAASNSSVPYRWWWGYSSNDRHQQITDGNGNDIGGTIAEVNGLQVGEDEWVSEVIIGGIDPDNWVVNLTPGTYWLTFEIDSPSANQELNEGNNVLSESFTVAEPFEVSLTSVDIKSGSVVDHDADGFMSEWTYAFTVVANKAGSIEFQLYEDDVSIGDWGDDEIWPSPVYALPGSGTYTFEYTLITDDHGLGHGQAEFWLKVLNAVDDSQLDRWNPVDDPQLRNVQVERGWQDTNRDIVSGSFVDVVRNHVSNGLLGKHLVFTLGASLEVEVIVDALSGLAAPTGVGLVALQGLSELLDFAGTNLHLGISLDVSDLLGLTRDSQQGYVTCFLSAGATLVDLDVQQGIDLPVKLNLSMGFADCAGDAYYGEPDLNDLTLASLYGRFAGIEASVALSADGNVNPDGEFSIDPLSDSTWALDAGVKILEFNYNFLSFDIRSDLVWSVLAQTAFSPYGAFLYNVIDEAVTTAIPNNPSTYSLMDIVVGYLTNADVPPLVRWALPDESGFLDGFAGGLDADGDGDGDFYYPVVSAGETPPTDLPFLSFLNVNNTSPNAEDFFVEVEDVPTGWYVEAADGWTYDRKFDVTDVPLHGLRTTRWIVAPRPGAQDAELRFDLFHDGAGFWANEYIGSWTVPVHVGDPPPLPSVQINDVSLSEGNSGTKNFDFTVSLSNPSSQTVTVNYGSADSSAVAPGDYTPVSGTLTFTPGQTSKTVSVLVNGDTIFEADETFSVVLSNVANALMADDRGVGTILNDDQQLLENWTGSVNTRWDNGANWSAGVVPGAGVVARIDGAAARQPVMEQDQTVWGLDLAAGGALTFAPGAPKTLVTKTLTIAETGGAPTARLDIGSGAIIVDYDDEAASPLEDVKSWIAAGYNGMTWTGNGLASSAAAANPIIYGVGYAQNDMLFAPYNPYNSFAGQPVDSSCVLVKYTYNGDLNLDGCVDDNDVSILGLYYDGGATSTHYWNQGDLFGYDGRIDDNDVSIQGLTYGLGVGNPLDSSPVGAMSEPPAATLAAPTGPAAQPAAAMLTPASAVPTTLAATQAELRVEGTDLLAYAQALPPRQALLASVSGACGADVAPPARMARSGATGGLAFLPSLGTSEAGNPPPLLLTATSTPLAWSTAKEVAPPADAVLSPDGGIEDLLLLPAR
jgi:subtilase family serine protease